MCSRLGSRRDHELELASALADQEEEVAPLRRPSPLQLYSGSADADPVKPAKSGLGFGHKVASLFARKARRRDPPAHGLPIRPPLRPHDHSLALLTPALELGLGLDFLFPLSDPGTHGITTEGSGRRRRASEDGGSIAEPDAEPSAEPCYGATSASASLLTQVWGSRSLPAADDGPGKSQPRAQLMEAGAGPVRQSPMQSPFAGTSRFGLLDADAAGTFLAADVFTVTVAARTLPYRYDSAVSYDGDAPYAAGIAAGEQAAGGSEPLPSLPVLAAPAAAAAAARHSTSSLSAAATCGGSLDPSWASSQPRCHRLPALRSSQLGAVALASSPSAASRGPGPSAETDEAQSGPRLPGPESLRSLSSYANLSAASSSATVGRTAAAFGRSRSTPLGLVLPPSERSQDPPAASSTSATASPKAQPASPRPPPRPPALVISSRASSSHVFPHVDHPIPATDAPRRGPARSASPSHQSPALAPSLQSPPSSLLPPAAAGGRVKPAWLEAKATEEQEYDEEPQGGGYLTPPLPGIRTPASPRSPVPPLSLGLLGPRQDRWATATPHSQPHSPRSPSTAPPLFPREGRRAEPDAEPSPAASLLGLGPGPGPGPGRLGQGLGRCASQELGGCVPPRPRLLAPIRRAATRLCVQSPDPHEQSASSSGAPRPAEPGAWTRPALPEGWSDATPLSLGQEEELGAA